MIVEESSHINQLKRLFSEQDDVQTDEMQQRITDFLPAIVYVYDTNSRKLRYINKQVTDVLGYSFEDIRSWDNDVLQMVFKDDLQLVKQQLESCFEMSDDDKCAYQARFNHKEGSCKYFKTMGTVLRRDENGRASSVLFVAEDVTGQVQSMDEIRNARELLNDTEELLQFGTWQWDIAGRKPRYYRMNFIFHTYTLPMRRSSVIYAAMQLLQKRLLNILTALPHTTSSSVLSISK
jgi:PAS domain S-box-containing protein